MPSSHPSSEAHQCLPHVPSSRSHAPVETSHVFGLRGIDALTAGRVTTMPPVRRAESMKFRACGNIRFLISHLATASSRGKSSQPNSAFLSLIATALLFSMAFTDILSLILSFGIIFSLRYLFPRNIVPLVSMSFEEAVALLQRAEAFNIPYVSEYRTNLAMYACPYPLDVPPS